MQDRGIQIADGEATAAHRTGQGDRPATQGVRCEQVGIEGMQNPGLIGQESWRIEQRMSHNLIQAQCNTHIKSVHNCSGIKALQTRGREELREPQILAGQKGRERLVGLSLHRADDRAEIDLAGELNILASGAIDEIIGAGQTISQGGDISTGSAIDIPAKGRVGTDVLMGLTHQPALTGAEQIMEFRLDAELPVVCRRRQATDIAQLSPGKQADDVRKVVSRPVLMHELMGDVVKILPDQGLNECGRSRVIREVLGLIITKQNQIRHRIAHFLQGIAFTQLGILTQNAANGLEVSPAGHRVVADQQQPTRSQMTPGDRKDLFAHLSRNPAQHAMQSNKIKQAQVRGQARKIGGQDTGIGKSTSTDIIGSKSRVLRV